MKKVLIVHDSDPFVSKLQNQLIKKNISVLTARSGDEAFPLQKAEMADLVITRTDFPGTSGINLCRYIKTDPALSRTYVVLTGKEKRAQLEQFDGCGASLYLWEGLQPELFVEKATQFILAPVRSEVKVMVRVQLTASTQHDSFFCNSVDISASGILLETGEVMEKGDIVTSSFFIPGSGQIQVECEVMRKSARSASQFQYGIKFLNLSPEDKSAIEKFVSSRNGKG